MLDYKEGDYMVHASPVTKRAFYIKQKQVKKVKKKDRGSRTQVSYKVRYEVLAKNCHDEIFESILEGTSTEAPRTVLASNEGL